MLFPVLAAGGGLSLVLDTAGVVVCRQNHSVDALQHTPVVLDPHRH